ncbi:MAG: HD domain-containing protein [Hydrogenothermaceae bacterium]|nr:HD domain-containing protein [Hydrogenothermaceae bacterium]
MSNTKKFEVLLELAGEITREKEPENLIPLLADMVKNLLNVDRCSLFLYDENRDVLFTVVAHGKVKIEVAPNRGIVGASFRDGVPLIVQEAYADPRFNKEVDKQTGYVTKNILSIPLFNTKKKVIGVFEAINKIDGDFTDEDLKLFQLLSIYAANTIEASTLYKKIEDAYKETIYRLAFAAEYKDPETYNHIVRIGFMASTLGQKINLEKALCNKLQLAAPMHDIGKIGIPDRVLLKKGRLEGEEIEIMRKHTIIGYEILKDSESELLQMASRIALEHHEKWDGTGYPYGKRGDEISVEARIVSIIDVFDALTSNRPYKTAWSITDAVKYMEELSGKDFDPYILSVFLENLQEFIKIKSKYKDEI